MRNSVSRRVGSAGLSTAPVFRARTGLVPSLGAPSLCSLGPEVAIFRKSGPGNSPLASRRSRRGLWPLLALALRAHLWRERAARRDKAKRAVSAWTDGQTFEFADGCFFERLRRQARSLNARDAINTHSISRLPFARTSPGDHQSVWPSLLALYRSSVAAGDRSRASFAESALPAVVTAGDAWLRLSLGAL